jgi:hypothetical protein
MSRHEGILKFKWPPDAKRLEAPHMLHTKYKGPNFYLGDPLHTQNSAHNIHLSMSGVYGIAKISRSVHYETEGIRMI